MGWSALAPIAMLAVVFIVFGSFLQLPIELSAILGSVGGTVSLLFHEVGHARAAWEAGSVQPTSMSLIWAGAATRFEGRYRTGRDQISVAIAGPRASFVFAATLVAVCILPSPVAAKEALLLLAVFNIGLGILNLLPAYPLDGHKLVVGLLWSATGSERKARRIVRRIGVAWAVAEVLTAVVLTVKDPRLGLIVIAIAGSFLAQKRFARRNARPSKASDPSVPAD